MPGSDVTVSAFDAGVNSLVVGGHSGAPVKLNIVSSDKEGGNLGFLKDSQIRPTGIVDVVSGPDAKTYTSSFEAENGATLTNDGRINTSGYEGPCCPTWSTSLTGPSRLTPRTPTPSVAPSPTMAGSPWPRVPPGPITVPSSSRSWAL